MAKMISFFLIAFIVISLWGAVMQSGGGIAATQLNGALTATATTITVDTTTNFINLDVITIGDEDVLYAAKGANTFTGCTRGYNGTVAKAHTDNTRVYTQQAGMMNQMAGYNISKIVDATGFWACINIPIAVFSLLINAFLLGGLEFLGTDLAIVTYVWMALGIGLIVTIGIAMAGGRRV